MNRILLVSYHFPPSITARALQIGKLLKYATMEKLKFDVVHADIFNDKSSIENDWWESPIGVRTYTIPEKNGHMADKLSSLFASLPYRNWSMAATDRALSLIESNGVNYYSSIITCGMPMDSHIIGLKVKKRYRSIPWIAHFSDPWFGSPFVPKRRFWQPWIQKNFENRIAEKADKLVFVSEHLRKHFISFHTGCNKKSEILEHTFDPELYETECKPHSSDDIFRITYVGGFNAQRTYEPIIKLVNELTKHMKINDNLEFSFVGGQTHEAVAALNNITPNIAICHGAVSYKESLRLMGQSDCLLVVDANFKTSPFFPSKLVDYFGTNLPIVGISPPESCTTQVLNYLNMPVFSYDQIDKCATRLAQAVSGSIPLPKPSKDSIKHHEPYQAAARLALMVNELSKK